MSSYVFMSDSDSDLLWSIAKEREIPIVRMPYILDGEEHFDDGGESGSGPDFFRRMREGATPSTSLLPTAAYLEYFEPILKEKDLLFVAFSSKMSNTFQNVLEAQKILCEKYPERKFIVVDTLAISGVQGALLLKAHDLYRAGMGMEELAKWIEDNRLRSHAFFTVDDLKYLKRGGRISAASAAIGSMLSIKPILVMNREGKLVPFQKVKGRKKALQTIVEYTRDTIEDEENQELILLHADTEAEAETVASMLREALPKLKSVRIQMIGPVIGAHCGPGTIACCFMGKERLV